jgi:hypothetical protein
VEVNQKRQLESQPAPDALPEATKLMRRQNQSAAGSSWHRWALAGFGSFALVALSVLPGCPGNLENPERFSDGGTMMPADNIPACLANIFSAKQPPGKCAGNGCHSAGGTLALGGNLDLTSPGVGARLVNATATHAGVDLDGGATCPPAKLIDTANPAASWLLVKINGSQGTCGSAMPQVGTLTSAEKKCISDYVMMAATGGGGAPSGGSGGASTGGTGGSTAIAGTGGAAAGGAAAGSGGAAAGSGGAPAAGSGGVSGSSGSGGASSGTGGT